MTSALGGIVGVSYLIVRSRRDQDDDDEATAEGAAPAEGADRANGGNGGLEPLPGPITPLAEPKHPKGKPINSSHYRGGVVQEPATELLRQARRHAPDITMDELTGARLAVSEHGRGTFTELACIVDSELNRAERKGISLFESLTIGGKFGQQGQAQDGKRRAATRQDPLMRHLLAARAVLSGKARGVSRGAIQFFDPMQMEIQHQNFIEWDKGGRKGKEVRIVSCDALGILEAWCFDYRKKKGHNRCPPDRSRRGNYTLAWVGPIAGVDPLRLMLMKRMKPGPEHQRRYEEARELLRRGLKLKG